MRSFSSRAWVIDDDQTYQAYLTSYLHLMGYTVKGFTNGDENLKNLKEKPDLIILDHQRCDMNTDVLRTIKEEKAEIPVIYISSQEKYSLLSEACRNESIHTIENNSASLQRLKLRIEKIEKIQSLKRKRRRYKAIIYSLVAIFWTIGILFFLFNMSL
jgi:DNA-binding NtrC family response regulator